MGKGVLEGRGNWFNIIVGTMFFGRLEPFHMSHMLSAHSAALFPEMALVKASCYCKESCTHLFERPFDLLSFAFDWILS